VRDASVLLPELADPAACPNLDIERPEQSNSRVDQVRGKAVTRDQKANGSGPSQAAQDDAETPTRGLLDAGVQNCDRKGLDQAVKERMPSEDLRDRPIAAQNAEVSELEKASYVEAIRSATTVEPLERR
jgi:hypothetical protein